MVLGEDAVVFPADEKPDGLVVDRRVQDMLRNRHIAARICEHTPPASAALRQTHVVHWI